jgi:predicted aminopeptidase
MNHNELSPQRYKYRRTAIRFYLRIALSMVFFLFFMIAAYNFRPVLYFLKQGYGQIRILLNTDTIESYCESPLISDDEKESITLIKRIRDYSVDTLGYLPTGNFTSVYNDNQGPVLWAITASQAFEMKAYEWWYPFLGNLSYKGFFDKNAALKEYERLLELGLDVELGAVSAWSTLGWLNDPIMSSMLKRSKGDLCNLIFHELFHSTYYGPGKTDFNENIASFVAHKATQRFLAKDTLSLRRYLQDYRDRKIYNDYILDQTQLLIQYYKSIKELPNRLELKSKALHRIADSIHQLPLFKKEKFISRKNQIVSSKNAYFINYQQYDKMQDHLDTIFNKFYGANLENLVRDLRLNKFNY